MNKEELHAAFAAGFKVAIEGYAGLGYLDEMADEPFEQWWSTIEPSGAAR